ncbi:MAG TPA: cytochrome c3 family protein [Steroidobacteraceae bacterium]|nr:cytochrome c3 family protein [Steroidobacteraceae bacterium]
MPPGGECRVTRALSPPGARRYSHLLLLPRSARLRGARDAGESHGERDLHELSRAVARTLPLEHQPVSEDCTNCHTPHGSVQPALLKERPPILCQQCHDPAGHPSVPYGPQGLPGMPAGMPNPYLLVGGCVNCHSQVHGSNSPSGRDLMR